jgi:hypothetical protein
MGKFNKFIARNGDQIIGDRAKRVAKLAEAAQQNLIREKEKQIMELEDRLEAMLDMSPDNRFSLKIGETFDADAFVKQFNEISIKLELHRRELDIMTDIQDELFSVDGNE